MNFTENGQWFWPSSANTFPMRGELFLIFLYPDKKTEKSHIFQHPFRNPAHKRVNTAYDMNEIIHG